MEKRKLGNSDLMITTVSLGTWGIGGDYFGDADEKAAIDALRAGVDNGINLIDTAPVYGRGRSEEIVGKAIQGGYRDKIVLATKCGLMRRAEEYYMCSDPFYLRDGVEGSLRRLGADVIDLMQIHFPDPVCPIEDTMNELMKMKQEGKIRYIGVSNFSIEQMEAAKQCGEVVSLQPKYSMIDREIDDEIRPYCIKENIGILTYGSISGGILTGKYQTLPEKSLTENRWQFYKGFSEPGFSQVKKLLETVEQVGQEIGKNATDVSIAWVTHREGVTTALVGVKSVKHAIANAASGEVILTAEQVDRINKAYNEIFNQ